MTGLRLLASTPSPLATRFSRLAPLAPAELDALGQAERNQRRSPARREMVALGDPVRERRALVSGWAGRQRVLADGRRPILGVLLPGDLLGMGQHRNPIAPTSIVAITEVMTVPLPAAAPGSALAEAYARSVALEEFHNLAQFTRLRRLDAYERIADWLLETRERLAHAGLTVGGHFPLPMTQEILADTLGLTSVHVNRTLQAMRRDGLLVFQDKMMLLPDPERLATLVEYRPARVRLGDPTL